MPFSAAVALRPSDASIENHSHNGPFRLSSCPWSFVAPLKESTISRRSTLATVVSSIGFAPLLSDASRGFDDVSMRDL